MKYGLRTTFCEEEDAGQPEETTFAPGWQSKIRCDSSRSMTVGLGFSSSFFSSPLAAALSCRCLFVVLLVGVFLVFLLLLILVDSQAVGTVAQDDIGAAVGGAVERGEGDASVGE